jgi:hypothetical protein
VADRVLTTIQAASIVPGSAITSARAIEPGRQAAWHHGQPHRGRARARRGEAGMISPTSKMDNRRWRLAKGTTTSITVG